MAFHSGSFLGFVRSLLSVWVEATSEEIAFFHFRCVITAHQKRDRLGLVLGSEGQRIGTNLAIVRRAGDFRGRLVSHSQQFDALDPDDEPIGKSWTRRHFVGPSIRKESHSLRISGVIGWHIFCLGQRNTDCDSEKEHADDERLFHLFFFLLRGTFNSPDDECDD